MLILVVLPFDMFYHAGKAINHMTSSEVCTKVAEKGKHVTFRAYLACKAHDPNARPSILTKKSLPFTYMRPSALFAYTENARFQMSCPRSMSR